MRYIGGLGLIFAIVAGVLSLIQVEGLQDQLVAATSGNITAFVGLVSTFWVLILGAVAVLIVGGVVISALNR